MAQMGGGAGRGSLVKRLPRKRMAVRVDRSRREGSWKEVRITRDVVAKVVGGGGGGGIAGWVVLFCGSWKDD